MDTAGYGPFKTSIRDGSRVHVDDGTHRLGTVIEVRNVDNDVQAVVRLDDDDTLEAFSISILNHDLWGA